MTLTRAISLYAIIFTISISTIGAQSYDPSKYVAATVQLDSVVIMATKGDFSIEDFIDLVMQDESLYTAFHNLRSASYLFRTQMHFEDKKGNTDAIYRALHRQHYRDSCRSMETLEEKWSGRFFKGKSQQHRYYTFSLYDRLFLTHDTICTAPAKTSGDDRERSATMENHVDELKTLIFRPGHRAHIPFIGKKTEIFSEDMVDEYDFSIQADTLRSMPVYRFTAKAKDSGMDQSNKTLFKELVTWFSRDDFRVLARTWHLSQNRLAYMFDVRMEVELLLVGSQTFPAMISYSGEWNIPTKKKEQGAFVVYFSEFQ